MNHAAKPALPSKAVVLFQGDSITDAQRDRNRTGPNDAAALGCGYAGRVGGDLLAKHHGAGWRIYNRACSGDRVCDLVSRWRRDALALNPDLVSILVGVNDTWHEHLTGNGVTVERYAALYRMLLEDTRAARPNVRLVLGEPFALPGGEIKPAWMEELRARAAIVHELAGAFDALFVAYQTMFDEALRKYSPTELALDGVHPSALGHTLMARAWREATGL